MSAYAIDPTATDSGFHFLYDDAVGVIFSDEPQLFEVKLVRSNGSPALTGQCFVDMLPQPGLFSVQKHFIASGQQVLPLTCAADFMPGDLFGVAHAPLLRVPLNALQHDDQAGEPHPGQTAGHQVSAVTSSPATGEAASAVTSPSPALLDRLNQDQRSSILRVWAGLPPHLREIAFNLHDPGWTPSAIDQLGNVLCEFPDMFSTSKTDFWSCSLMPFEISIPEGSAPVTSRPHRINPILAN